MTKLLFGRHVGSFRALHYDGIPLVESRDGLIRSNKFSKIFLDVGNIFPVEKMSQKVVRLDCIRNIIHKLR